MSTSTALYSSASLKAANAQPYSSMEGKLDPMLLLALKDMKFEFMTPVQSKVLGGLPSLQSDCLVQAKTGTGKTTAFLLPAIQNTLTNSTRKGQVSILIMSPTRELALQIAAEASQLVAKLRRPLEVHTAFGGTAKASYLSKFKHGDPKILVATPHAPDQLHLKTQAHFSISQSLTVKIIIRGRLNDYLSEEEIRAQFSGIKTLILDEADRMLDQGFLPDILKVLRALPPKPTGQWQGMCFSATIPPKMQQVLSNVLKKDHVSISTIDTSEPPTLAKVPQFSVTIPKIDDTFAALFSLIKQELKITEGESKIIVFGTTANLVALYSEVFDRKLPLTVYELHSRMTQPARTKATEAFKAAKNGIMFATDVIGRGMDFPDVSLVLQVGLPADADSYTHRVGRTARAGKDGRAIILLTEGESFFLKVNRQFPIQPYPASAQILNDSDSAETMTTALQAIDFKSKQKAYSAFLGFMKGFLNKMQLSPAGLVKLANDFALKGMQSGEVPGMERKTIGKMGLKGVPGLRIVTVPHDDQANHKRGAPIPDRASENDGLSRRLRHQGVPESKATTSKLVGSGNAGQGGYIAPRGQGLGRGASNMRANGVRSRAGAGARGGQGRGGASGRYTEKANA